MEKLKAHPPFFASGVVYREDIEVTLRLSTNGQMNSGGRHIAEGQSANQCYRSHWPQFSDSASHWSSVCFCEGEDSPASSDSKTDDSDDDNDDDDNGKDSDDSHPDSEPDEAPETTARRAEKRREEKARSKRRRPCPQTATGIGK